MDKLINEETKEFSLEEERTVAKFKNKMYEKVPNILILFKKTSEHITLAKIF